MDVSTFKKNFSEKLPDVPGVYFFVDEGGLILYIGKATSLKDRVKSYFSQDIPLTRGPKIVRMLEKAKNIRWKETGSVLEALLLEANLIHRHLPPYNTDAKDDKSWNFVVITKERFPRVLVKRGRNIELLLAEGVVKQKKELGYVVRKAFGPFPSGGALRESLLIIRKIFPFRDTCTPQEEREENRRNAGDILKSKNVTAKKKSTYSGIELKSVIGADDIHNVHKDNVIAKNPCFNHQIGLCPGVCVGVISSREYLKTIRHIELFFSGKKKILTDALTREMHCASKELRFERAGEIKKILFSLDHIREVALLRRSFLDRDSDTVSSDQTRMEAYDVAHLGGEHTVGVMTVMCGNEPDSSSYRKFIIRGEAHGNDLASLEELLRRRFRHEEWLYPSCVIVDGSDVHRAVAEAVLAEFTLDIPVISVLKDERHKPKDILGNVDIVAQKKDSILFANAEAHRFAISFHRKRRGKAFLGA